MILLFVAQFDALLAILEPNIKKKTTDFRELSVQEPKSALCYKTKWININNRVPFWILPFACTVALNCQNASQFFL